MKGRKRLLIFLAAGLVSCSQQQVYELVRENRLGACEQNVEAAAEECRRDFSRSYDEYQESLQTLEDEQ